MLAMKSISSNDSFGMHKQPSDAENWLISSSNNVPIDYGQIIMQI